MKSAVASTLTLTHLRRLDRSIYIATACSILLVAYSLFWMLFCVSGESALFSNFAYTLAALIGAVWTFHVTYSAWDSPIPLARRYRMSWLFIGCSLLSSSLGGAYCTYLTYTHTSSFPSYDDIGFTSFYIFLFVALLYMPTELPFRTRIALDALITTLCFFGISWFFVLGPVYLTNMAQVKSFPNIFSLLLGFSYPCWDILLILAIVLLIQRRTERILHPSFALLASGIIAQIWGDTGYSFTDFFVHTRITGTPSIDTFWFIGSLLIGLAVLYQYVAIVRHAYSDQHSVLPLTEVSSFAPTNEVANGAWRQLQSLAVYIPLAFMLILTVIGELFYDDIRAKFLVVLTVVIGILVVVRYLRTTNENEILSQFRERERVNAEHLRQISTILTSILDIEPLLATIPVLAQRDLGFDAAILLIRENHHQKMGPQSYILINTASAFMAPTKWRLVGDTFFYFLVISGKDIEIRWDTLTHDIPAEIHLWQKEQRCPTMNFFPLICDGEVLGCLGLTRREALRLDKSDILLAKTYIEQVVTIIQKAYLYKEACEHEAFARAMANIATRLNSAAVVPSEIQQLICTEGANALQADYAILYIVDENGRLSPIAVHNSATNVQGTFNQWPPIQSHENEAQIFYSLQPVLMHLSVPYIQELSYHEITSPLQWNTQQLERKTATPSQTGIQVKNNDSAIREYLVLHNINTAIFAPLIAGGKPTGLLIFGRSVPFGTRDKQALDNGDLPLAQDFAEQAAVALTNAHLYQHLRNTHQRMQELDQLKDQFMVTASHELRTPLTAVQGYIELLSQYDDILASEQRQEFTRKAQRSCEELVVILNNVMDASRLEIEAGIRPTLLERTDVREIVESVITIIEPQVKQERRDVQIMIPLRTYIMTDPVRLRQVLMNISVNAMKYSPYRTPIIFTTTEPDHDSSSLVLRVTDKGNGISLQDQARLFQRFVRLENDINSPVRGSGLGLYISRRLVEAMGGKIWIESTGVPGQATSFCIRLPLE